MNAQGSAPALNSSQALQAGGSLLVDNNIIVSVTPNGGVASIPTNVCAQPFVAATDLSENCFNGNYETVASDGILTGNDTDTFVIPSGYPGAGQTADFSGGIAPIDISSLLSTTGTGQQSVNIQLDDEGVVLTGSTIFLTTNCTQNGVTGPATVSGNTITTSSNQGVTQSFNFDTGTGQNVGFVYDVSQAANTLSSDSPTVATPQSGDLPLDPGLFQKNYVPGTSFATSNCLIHTGEELAGEVTSNGGTNPNLAPACKLYTLECTTPNNSTPSGANCPVSVFENEVVQDVFDGPPFSLQAIYTPFGVFQEGIGFLMASDTWPGNSTPSETNCGFDPSSGLQTLPCPQNLLDSFSGPGKFSGTGLTTNPNSTFISIYGVPEDHTSVFVAGEWPDNWVNSNTPNVYFFSQPPNLSKGASVFSGGKFTALPGAANYIPQPIKGITYGIAPAGTPPPVPVNEPIVNDTFVPSGTTCPTGLLTAKSQPVFMPPVQTVTNPGSVPLADGKYLLHYYAQDCAGTQELLFTQPPSNQNPNPGPWSTSFYTYPVNVDTIAPQVTGITPSPVGTSFKVGSVVTASYSCTDANSPVNNENTGSGVVLCGLNLYAPETTYNTGTLKTRLNTGSTGAKSFTVYAVDGAGNISSSTFKYTVTK
jgi:hypothetical protein